MSATDRGRAVVEWFYLWGVTPDDLRTLAATAEVATGHCTSAEQQLEQVDRCVAQAARLGDELEKLTEALQHGLLPR